MKIQRYKVKGRGQFPLDMLRYDMAWPDSSDSNVLNQTTKGKQPMKYIVWIKEDGKWIEQGDGPLTRLQAERISQEIRKECGCAAKVLPEGVEP